MNKLAKEAALMNILKAIMSFPDTTTIGEIREVFKETLADSPTQEQIDEWAGIYPAKS